MQIPVQVSGEGLGEWMMVELQGKLKTQPHITMAGKLLGDLHFNKQGIPILMIGHHILHGTVQNLPKPLAVMKKIRGDREALESYYSVTAVIRKKVLFKDRPKPIVKIEDVKNVMH